MNKNIKILIIVASVIFLFLGFIIAETILENIPTNPKQFSFESYDINVTSGGTISYDVNGKTQNRIMMEINNSVKDKVVTVIVAYPKGGEFIGIEGGLNIKEINLNDTSIYNLINSEITKQNTKNEFQGNTKIISDEIKILSGEETKFSYKAFNITLESETEYLDDSSMSTESGKLNNSTEESEELILKRRVLGYAINSIMAYTTPHKEGRDLLYMWVIGSFAGGSGTAVDPWQISNCSQLNEIRNNLTASYILINNINCSETISWNSGLGWLSVGNETAGFRFTGVLDGDGYAISDLHINMTTSSYVGFFSYLGGGSIVKDLTLNNFNVTGFGRVGALAGEIEGSIINVDADGFVLSKVDAAGGLVYAIRTSTGEIINSSTNVTVNSSGQFTGGLAGSNAGLISNSSSIGSVRGNIYVGGLVGINDGGKINYSYSTGNLIGSGTYMGGLVGVNQNSGIINNSYSTGIVSSTSTSSTAYIGGLVGYHLTGVVNNASSTGNVTSSGTSVGGLIGRSSAGVTTNSYSTGNVLGSVRVGGLIGECGTGSSTNTSYSTGTVNSTISNPGDSLVGGLIGILFAGTLSNSYSTGNVYAYGNNTGGLIGFVNGGIISNSYSTGIVNSTGTDAGGLVGRIYAGTIAGSYSSSTVLSYDRAGGLLGEGGTGSSTNTSYSTGNVEITRITGASNAYVGGLVAINFGNVSNCYSTGNVTARVNNLTRGGLIGRNEAGRLIHSYSTGYVNYSNTGLNGGGLVGTYSPGTDDNNFWDTQTSTWTTSGMGDGKTTAQMKDIDTFNKGSVNWDMVLIGSYTNQIWKIDNGVDYPRLGWEVILNAAPISTLNSPADNSWSQTSLNTFNCSQSDSDGNLYNTTLYLWKSPLVYTNTSNITGLTNSTNFTRDLTDGAWLWNCLVYDNLSASDWATNRTINVDTTNPLVSYGLGTELNNTNFSRDWIYVNTSIIEANFNNITFYLYFSNYTLLNSSTYTNGEREINWTTLLDGTYYYNVTARDISGRENSTAIMNITLDDTPPIINIIYPIDSNSYNNGTAFQINYSVSDSLIGLNMCWYTNNSGTTNTTITCGNNITIASLLDGTYTYTIYSNDSLSNLGSTSVTFTISSLAPAINLDYPTLNQYINSKINVYFNFTATDSDGLSSCQLWTNTTGIWAKNYTWISPISGSTNYTKLNLTEGVYKYNVWCNDTVNNGQFSPNNFTFMIDTTNPDVVDNSYLPLIVYNETNVTIYGNISDINLNMVWIEINYSGSYQNITITEHTGDTYNYNLSNLETNNNENISWKWWANDSAGNLNFSALNYFVVTNRNPYNLTISSPSNNSYINTNYLIINFSATDDDYDTLNYSIYYGNGTLFNSTLNNYINFTGFNATDAAVNMFYVNVSDGYLTNQSGNYTFSIDKIAPSLVINKPDASPVLQCSLSNVYLNLTATDSNIDYCTLNVTYSGTLLTSPHTIFNCSNTYFNVTLDSSVQLLSVGVFDKAGNVNVTQRYLYFSTYDSSCSPATPPGGGGGGGAPVIINVTVPSNQTYCGDGICQTTGNDLGLKEDFFSCSQDCAGFNIDSAIFYCFDDNTNTVCIWDSVRYQYIGLAIGILASILAFSTIEDKKTKKQVSLIRYYILGKKKNKGLKKQGYRRV